MQHFRNCFGAKELAIVAPRLIKDNEYAAFGSDCTALQRH